jgi:Coenzyme F390 synthetase
MTNCNWNDTEACFHPTSAVDFLPQAQLRELQLQRLRAIVSLAYDNVEFVRNRMDERGVKPSDIKELKDIAKLPFMQKNDLRDTYPYGLFAVPMSEIVRLHASSGTTGKPIVVGYTAEDMDVWTSTVARSLIMFGIRRGDILQNSFGYGLFTGGLGLHSGAESLGCTVVPVSGGNSERQLMLLKDFGVTAISCTPSYFIHLIEESQKLGVNLKQMPLRFGVFGAEPWSEEMRKYIEANTNITACDIYGLSEIAGPGVGAECNCHNGIHIFEDHYYPEIVDPETGEPLPDGEEGELVLTTLSKRAMPILRYRTHDLTTILAETCECGRTIRRIKRIGRRSDDMFIIRGVNVFPSQIEAALMNVEETTPNYMIYLERKKDLDTVLVEVELKPECFRDSLPAMEAIARNVRDAIARIVGIRIEVKIVELGSIARSQGKAKRVVDNRKI